VPACSEEPSSDDDEEELDDDDEEDEEESGPGAGAAGGAGGAGAELEVTDVDEMVVLLVVEKMTRLALSPSGTVTMQNSAPPAPTLPPVHEFMPIVLGLHSHGMPLQLPEGQSIRMAKPGSTLVHWFAEQQ
jgi:hypothetical protein